MQESDLTKGPHAKAFEALKSDRSDLYEKLEELHFVAEDQGRLSKVFNGFEEFGGFIGVTFTSFDKQTGGWTADIMAYDAVDKSFRCDTEKGVMSGGGAISR
jgi:hypothetical protein